MNYIRKFRKNAKALSPVVASIILIAVTVAVSVVVAAWMGGMTIGLMGNAEQAKITDATFNAVTDNGVTTCNSTTVTIQNTGSSTVTISTATIDGNSVSMNKTDGTAVTSFDVAKGQTDQLVLTLKSGDFTNTAQYQIKLQTSRGNTITYTATYTGQ